VTPDGVAAPGISTGCLSRRTVPAAAAAGAGPAAPISRATVSRPTATPCLRVAKRAAITGRVNSCYCGRPRPLVPAPQRVCPQEDVAVKRQSRSTRLALAIAAAGIALPVFAAGATQTVAGTAILRQSVTHTEAGTAILRHASVAPNGTAIL